jgi:hypothetical protein
VIVFYIDEDRGDVLFFKNNRVKYYCNNGLQLFPNIEFEFISLSYRYVLPYFNDNWNDYQMPTKIIAKEPNKPMSVYSESITFENKEEAVLLSFIREFDDGNEKQLVLASKNGKMGLLDENGRLRIPFLFDNMICHYSDNLFITYMNGKEGLIDFNNNVIYPNEYLKGSFSEGLHTHNRIFGKRELFLVYKDTVINAGCF